MKEILLFILFSLSILRGYSQEKVTYFVDENYKEISFSEFERKTNSSFFVVATTSNDTAIFKKVRFREYFGKLNLKKKHQLNKLLCKKHNIDSTKIWLIHHTDTLPYAEMFHEKSGIILLDSLGREYGEIMSLEEFNFKHAEGLYNRNKVDFYKTHRQVRSFKDYTKILTKRKKELRKNRNTILLHFYNYQKNYHIENDKINWIKEGNLIFRNIFSDGNRIYNNVIIYPNGDFYAHSGRAPLWKQKKLLKRRNYNEFKIEWLNEYNKLTKL